MDKHLIPICCAADRKNNTYCSAQYYGVEKRQDNSIEINPSMMRFKYHCSVSHSSIILVDDTTRYRLIPS